MALPHAVMESEEFKKLSGSETKVLLMLAKQYKGKNNGDLSATFTQAKEYGIKSQETLSKALKRLLEVELIQKTREGLFLNPGGQCALYAVTWQAIDDCCGKLDVKATSAPPVCFSQRQ